MSLDHSHAPMSPQLRLRLWLLAWLEALLLPHRRRSRTAADTLAWIEREYACIHRDLHRDKS
ncbi:hypothetical protein [uncultured Sphingomonas sp.]|uniref:hypothetical protein n=1 Tax=uncultured Sphingomonas sp. TaxID=158754 RepID=UPI00261F83C9|nr:hypothetical protein [uncultured Sphingomonas sp.]